MPTTEWVLWAGLGLGVLYGIVAQISGFCLNSAMRLQLTQGEGTKLRSFALAIVVALICTQVAATWGLVDLSESIYITQQFSWLLVIAGGLMFGYGMILARGCGARTLVLLGQGNLRSLVVLLCLGISGYMALSGVLAPLRSDIAQATALHLEQSTFTSAVVRWGFVAALSGVLLVFVLRDKQFLQKKADLWGGVAVGLLVVAGWLITGWLGADDFDPTPVASLTFVAPIGATIQYAMIATGVSLNFGIVVVVGVVLGSFASATARGHFKRVGFDRQADMPRYIAGGVMMGVGGALAMGCSIGQGITGLSTLSFVSMVAFPSILAGSWLALRRDDSSFSRSQPIQGQRAS
jgi:uncharacterized membrane protein YedE/YeeE